MLPLVAKRADREAGEERRACGRPASARRSTDGHQRDARQVRGRGQHDDARAATASSCHAVSSGRAEQRRRPDRRAARGSARRPPVAVHAAARPDPTGGSRPRRPARRAPRRPPARRPRPVGQARAHPPSIRPHGPASRAVYGTCRRRHSKRMINSHSAAAGRAQREMIATGGRDPALEQVRGRAAVDRLGGDASAARRRGRRAARRRATSNPSCAAIAGRGVEQHGVADAGRARRPARRARPRRCALGRRRAAPAGSDRRDARARPGRACALGHRAAGRDPDAGRGRRGQLVQAVVAAEHQRGVAALGQHGGHDRRHPRGRRSRSPAAVTRAGLVSGPRKLKNVGTPSSRRGGAGVPHAGVEDRGEAEPDADLGDRARRRRRPAGRWPRRAPRARRPSRTTRSPPGCRA